jgi:dTDP-4-dehydrorhamnose 3,5-epimerase
MTIDPLAIAGTWSFAPQIHNDDRGLFLETFRAAELERTIGHRLSVAQVNCSVSQKGTVRGVHFADVPPSQAKYVTCLSGAILDVVVDIRVGSPSFGQWEAVRLDDKDRKAIYVREGIGHAFMALTDDALVTYLCSEPYAPAREHAINPLDPALQIAWPADIRPLMSPKDASAPSLQEAQAAGLLPSYDDCLALYAELRSSANR